uniref:Protocadherin 2 alpha a 1 n=1 Tax=Erpetoichthys calabaricus TaxID=27687 RepID=A0A8C4SMF2_ERPCA
MKRLRCYKQIIFHLTFLLCFWKYSSAHLRYSIPEESASGTIIGNIIKDLEIDFKSLESRGFRVIAGTKQQLLQVNHKTGALFINDIIDREAICDRDKACLLSFKIVIENPLEIHQGEIEIIDINDNSPAFPDKTKILDISESTPIGSRFPLDAAYDPDFGVNSLKSYQLNRNDHFVLEVEERSKKSKIPVLVLQKSLDRETRQKLDLLLSAIDGGNPPKSGNMNVTITVVDFNDNAPVFVEQMYTVTLEENAPLGTLVLKLNASDLDDGSNGDVRYAFRSSVHSKVSELFQLDDYSGEITVKGVIDFEEEEFYEFDVKATDSGQVPISGYCNVLIKIKDMNDNAPLIEVTSLTSSIFEDVKPGTEVGIISITDLDSGVNSKITCSLSYKMHFELKPSHQENVYSLVTISRLDRESVAQYNITITAKDFGYPSLSSYETVLVHVLDVNDNHPRFLQDPYVFYIEENNAPGAAIITISAVDADANENALITYYLKENDVLDKPVVHFLSINSYNGQVFSFTSFDFEEMKNCSFSVIAKDSGVPPLSSTVTVKVFILDKNDNPPVFVFPLTTNGTAVVEETIPRNVKAGHIVTRIRAYDADVGYNALLSFSLEDATDLSLFNVGKYTGEIKTLRSIAESDINVQKMVILVKDGGSVSFSASATVIVTATENTEVHALSEVKRFATPEDEESKVTFYLIIVLSSVSFLFIVTILTLIVFQCRKAYHSLLHKKYLGDTDYTEVSGSLFHSYQYQTADIVLFGIHFFFFFLNPQAISKQLRNVFKI